jgi:hypothetical protein
MLTEHADVFFQEQSPLALPARAQMDDGQVDREVRLLAFCERRDPFSDLVDRRKRLRPPFFTALEESIDGILH